MKTNLKRTIYIMERSALNWQIYVWRQPESTHYQIMVGYRWGFARKVYVQEAALIEDAVLSEMKRSMDAWKRARPTRAQRTAGLLQAFERMLSDDGH